MNGKYLDLSRLPRNCLLRGAVVHDESRVFGTALRKHNIKSRPVYIGQRFRGRLVRRKRELVLLVGTGMGCTGSSIVANELALQKREVPIRIIKIGTCVSTWQGHPVGTVFVPHCAVADEGVTTWGRRVGTKGHNLRQQVRQVFRNKELVRPHIGFRNEYRRFLRKDWNWGNLKPTWDLRKTAVWTSDAFYPIMYRPDFFGELSHGYMIQPSSTRGPAKVKIIQRQKRNNAGRGYAITGWDMEASSLFSAREVHKLKVTAALVVSWSSSHWISLGNNGITGRNQNHKKTAHAVEHSLIAAAVEYLFV